MSFLRTSLVALLLTYISFCFAQVSCEEGSIIVIPDENLRTVLQTTAKTTDSLRCEDLLVIKRLNAVRKNISNLSGLEYAQNLTVLNLGRNKIQDWSVLENFQKLTTLDISANNIDSLNLIAPLPKLKTLSVNHNNFSSLGSLKKFSSLTTLNIQNNQLNDLSGLIDLKNISTLNIGNNPLDLEQLKYIVVLENMHSLGIANLGFTSIDSLLSLIPNLESIKTLDISQNPIRDFSNLHLLTGLETLTAIKSSVTSLTQLGNLTNLKRLNLSESNIVSISDIASFPELTHLYLNDTGVTDLTYLIYLQNLTVLQLKNLNLKSIDILLQNPMLGTHPKSAFNFQGNCLEPNGQNAKLALEARGATVVMTKQNTCE